MRFLRPPAISDSFTYCAWIKTTLTGYGLNHYQLMFIVSTETGGVNNDFGFGIDSNGKLAYGDGKTGSSDITIRSSIAVNTGDWTFVAVTRSKSTGEVKLYINGILDTTGTCNVGNTLSTATYVLIGSETDFPGYTFGGNIGAILGNTSVLSAADVLNNFNAQRATYGL
jgi:MSHA biogenesis protein MshQ